MSAGGAPLEVLMLVAMYLVGALGHAVWRALQFQVDTGRGSPPVYSTTAAASGLTEIEASARFWGGHALHGRSGAFRIRLEQLIRSDEDRGPERATRILIERIQGKVVPITLRRESRGFLQRDLSAREIEIGDKAFDDDFYVTGPHTFVRALLDARTRWVLRTLLLEVDLEVSRGQLRGQLPMNTAWLEHERTLGRVLGIMLEVARHLERPADVVRCLSDNATLDPLPEVRLQNLLTLAREYPEDPATDATLVAAAARDASAWIRVRAATALGSRGWSTLLEIVNHDPPDDAAASQAIAVLGKGLPPDRVREILGRALRNRQQGIARACLASLGQGSGGDDVALMSKVMGMERGDLAVAAAEALASTGSPAAEAPLLAALQRDAPELRVAAARALGRVGTAAAVGPLKEAEARAGESTLSRAVRQAIAEIQSRLPGASPGQLSIASGESGTLSLVEDERGRLSLPADHDRQ